MSFAGFIPNILNNFSFTGLHRCFIFTSSLHFTRAAPSSSAHLASFKTSQARHKKDWQQLVLSSAIWKQVLMIMSKAEWNLEVKEGNVNKKNRKEANYCDKILKILFPLDNVCELNYLSIINYLIVFCLKYKYELSRPQTNLTAL